METKQDIMSMSHDELVAVIAGLGYPKFRADQLEDWVFRRGAKFISDFDNIPKNMRSTLEEHLFICSLTPVDKQVSEDGTVKYLLRLPDGACVETVGIPSLDGSRLTVCFSSQAGCPMGCVFCATGRSGFTRNLTAGEMYEQVRFVSSDFNKRVTNAVCMGQGEPFLNYDAVMNALRRMNSKVGLGIGARHITVSTCGIIDGIRRFSQEPEQFTLAVSLHSAIQQTRNEIMPGVSNIPLESLKETIKEYGERTKRRPSLEYAPIHNLNDNEEHMRALIDFSHGMLCHINLIPLNEIDEEQRDNMLEPSRRLEELSACLSQAGIENSIRNSRGKDIDGACGQLRQRYSN